MLGAKEKFVLFILLFCTIFSASPKSKADLGNPNKQQKNYSAPSSVQGIYLSDMPAKTPEIVPDEQSDRSPASTTQAKPATAKVPPPLTEEKSNRLSKN